MLYTAVRAAPSNLHALGIDGGTGILPVIRIDGRDACPSVYPAMVEPCPAQVNDYKDLWLSLDAGHRCG